MYEKGAITADHLVAQCLEMIDPQDPSSVLDGLPRSFLERIRDHAAKYRSGPMLTNYGRIATADQVDAASRWIDEALKVEPAASSKA
jgi:hypothetical protein